MDSTRTEYRPDVRFLRGTVGLICVKYYILTIEVIVATETGMEDVHVAV